MAKKLSINTITAGDSALLYNVVGRGQIFSYMRKHYKELLDSLKH